MQSIPIIGKGACATKKFILKKISLCLICSFRINPSILRTEWSKFCTIIPVPKQFANFDHNHNAKISEPVSTINGNSRVSRHNRMLGLLLENCPISKGSGERDLPQNAGCQAIMLFLLFLKKSYFSYFFRKDFLSMIERKYFCHNF